MIDSLNNKEIVAVGHDFAKAMSGDTPIIEIAKMMSRLAERLDCTTAALRETTKQRDALGVENAALKSGAAYFSYGSEHNFEWHKTAELAVEAAESAIDDHRGEACDGWSEEVDSICWGVIVQSSTKVGERPRTEDDSCDPAIDTVCDYALLPTIKTPATAAFLAEVRASGVEKLREHPAIKLCSLTHVCDEFAAQFRQGGAE
ncbi:MULTISPECIES: hypothetical protein [Lelliottia]|uniref:Ead/Ea22-like family protein n=1 Tax=Lelliottia aquatilis TaxID=2080838 RepID=A0ABX5A510_9ENTR|nr:MULTISPECIES: hypothetical protein [Lelliottia]POZ24206.1 hypothetical protein C3712_08335 [Lelliottia aquatilis]POZ27393.1 hypothetical protein C3708_07320 [Lelliottia sp. 7254-16]POZ29663.1 hypothetical protein C3711_00530 [Lelliottia aquatilis]POZ35229.1 hypothetical protein C3710_00530 [Lelliottia aquatilis]POZ38790.1 hypothetical protein C3709_07315 [Lelliottia aquatilis]